MEANRDVREHVLYLLGGGGAHPGFEDVVPDLPSELRGAKPEGLSNSPWRLLEHMRVAQWDILEFCRSPEHVSPEFPAGLWPSDDAPRDDGAWERSVASFRADLEAVRELVRRTPNLFARIPHGDGQTYLREALLVADHNAYHLGQMVLIRKLLGGWPK